MNILSFFSLILHFSIVLSLNIEKFEYQIKKEKTLGFEITYALFDVHVDEKLFYFEAPLCIPGCNNQQQEGDCSPCDYSLQGKECGSSWALNSFNQTSTPICECEKKKEWCEDQAEYNEYITLEEGLSDWVYLETSKPSQTFRFHFNKKCHGVWLKVESLYGSVMSFFDKDLSVLRGNLMAVPEGIICPNDFYYQHGTYTFTVFLLWLEMSKVRVSLEYFPIQEEEVELKELDKCEGSSYIYCPKIGVPQGPISGYQLVPLIFKFTITECKHLVFHRELTWSSESTSGEIGLVFGVGGPVLDNKGYHITSPQNVVFGVCPPNDGSNSVDLYLSFVNLKVNFELIISIYERSDEWRMKEFSSYTMQDLFRILVGLFDIQCGNQLFTCRKGSFEWGTSCLEAWPVVPTNETTGLWPRPYYLYIQDTQTFSDLPFELNEPIVDIKLSGGLFLEFVTEDKIVRPFPNWRTELEQNCTVHFRDYSVITTSSGIPLTGSFPLKNKRTEPDCDSDNFHEISSTIDDLSLKMSQKTTSPEILGTRYIMDMQTFTPTWLGCRNKIESYLDEVQSEDVFYSTTSCPPELLDQDKDAEFDACCNSKVAWTTCCVPRTISYITNGLKLKDDMTNDNEFCGNSECMEPLLKDYIFYHQLRDSIQGCSLAIQESLSLKNFHVLEFYRDCKSEIFGYDGFGKDCLSDKDCQQGISQCDRKKNKCVFSNDEQLDQGYTSFFQCLDENMSVSVREYLEEMIKQKGNSESQQTFVEKMKEIYLIDECVEPIGRSSLSQGYHKESISEDTCPPCDYYCFDGSCMPSWRCEGFKDYGRPDSGCLYANIPIASNRVLCESQYSCNWNSSINSEIECIQQNYSIIDGQSNTIDSSEDSSFFCGFCTTPSSCIMVDIKTEEECLGMKGCLISHTIGGRSREYQKNEIISEVQILLGVSENECSNRGSCSIPCDQCDQKDVCLQSGYCTDIEYGEYLNFSTPYYAKSLNTNNTFSAPTTGFCVLPINEWNNPDCVVKSTDVSINIPTPLGCLTLEQNENSCKSKSGTWFEYSKNKEQCVLEKTCVEPDIMTTLTSQKNPTQCELCEGSPITVFDWKEAQWIEGESIRFEWIEKQWVPKNKWGRAIDFSTLSNDIKESATQSFSFELQTEAQCRLNPTKNTMEKILCFCSENSDQDLCLKGDDEVNIGVGRVCASQIYALVAPPSILQFDENSIESGCVNISVKTVLMSNIKKPRQSSISTSFRHKRTRVDSVKNTKGTYVGKLLGNGVSISFTGQNELNGFVLCLEIESKTDNSYPDFDFGLMLSEEEVRPLSIKINEQEGKICGSINVTELENIRIFPISRSKDWESEDDSLTDSEKAIFSVMFVLYVLLFIWKLVEEVNYGLKDLKPTRWIGVLVLACLFVRSLYFIFLLSEEISTTEDTLSEFLLVEIPTYLYFLAITITAILWSSVSRLKNARETTKTLVIYFSCVFIAALIFMISIVIAWDMSGESGTYKCGGRVYVEPDDSSQKSIRLAYRIIVSLATLAIAISLTYHGFKVYSVLNQNLSNSQTNEKLQKKILLVGWASTLSLLGQCIFFILYSELASPSEEWVLILIPLELIPMTFICLVLGSSKLSTKLTGSKQTSSSEGRSATTKKI